MKIKTKVLLGLSMIPLVILLLIGVGWYQIYSIKKASIQMQHKYEMVSRTWEIQRDVKNVGIELRNSILSKDISVLKKSNSALESYSKSINREVASLKGNNLTIGQKRLIAKLKTTNKSFADYQKTITTLVSNGQKDDAIKLLGVKGTKIQEEYSKEISDLSKLFQRNMDTSFNQISIDFRQKLLWGMAVSLAGLLLIISLIIRGIWGAVTRLNKVSQVMKDVSNGSLDLKTRIEIVSNDEIDDVVQSFNIMTQSLNEQVEKEQKLSKENKENAWVKSNFAEIMAKLTGLSDLQSFTRAFLSKVAPLIDASQAVFYIKEWDKEKNEYTLNLLSSYAFKERRTNSNCFRFGEGLVGQAALENSPILLTNVPPDYIRINSGLGESTPLNIYVLPVSFEGDVKAVIEVASFNQFSTVQQSLLDELIGSIGIMMESLMGRMRLADLLQESQVMTEELQAQSEELQSQQDELKATNEELEAQTQALKQSEEKLQVQQEELEEANAELREKAEIFEVQNNRLEATNKEVERARNELEEKANQLAISSKYKSEFLANMSHELRTPLNSLLILSKLLSDNPDHNLSEKQVEFAKTIYSSGSDLLTLINDILDLAKIESGKMNVNPCSVFLKDFAEMLERSFQPVANEKNLGFHIHLKEDVPEMIISDPQRLQQLLTNLLSNAFKFTHQGEVNLEIGKPTYLNNQYAVYFAVSDTGIGIPEDKRSLVFEAFQQADGTTSRKYGGTGLGLSICRELSSLLGGEIVVESVKGEGSTFTFYVNHYSSSPWHKENLINVEEVAVSRENQIDERMNEKQTSQPVWKESSFEHIKRLLIVDDDLRQRNSLMELIGDKNVIIKAVSTGAEAIEELKVDSFDCMVLDLGLSDISGFDLLEKMKANPLNENVRIFIYTGRDITTKEEMLLRKHAHTIIIKDSHSPQRLLEELEWFLNSSSDSINNQDELALTEPTKNKMDLKGKSILLVDDDVRNVFAISNILEVYGMKITFVENGIECLQKLKEHPNDFDLVLMDIMMPEMDGYETMREIRKDPQYHNLPIIALTAKAMKEDRERCIDAGASDYIVKPVIPEQLISLIRVWVYQDAKRK